MFYVFHLMAVNCSNRIKTIENQSSAWFTYVLLFFKIFSSFPSFLPFLFLFFFFFGFTFSLGFLFVG